MGFLFRIDGLLSIEHHTFFLLENSIYFCVSMHKSSKLNKLLRFPDFRQTRTYRNRCDSTVGTPESLVSESNANCSSRVSSTTLELNQIINSVTIIRCSNNGHFRQAPVSSFSCRSQVGPEKWTLPVDLERRHSWPTILTTFVIFMAARFVSRPGSCIQSFDPTVAG